MAATLARVQEELRSLAAEMGRDRYPAWDALSPEARRCILSKETRGQIVEATLQQQGRQDAQPGAVIPWKAYHQR